MKLVQIASNIGKICNYDGTIVTKFITTEDVSTARERTFPEDIYAGFKMHEVWLSFAWDETLSRYHRSILGIMWIILGYAVFVAGIALFFGSFAKMGIGTFTVYVGLGYAIYLFLIANIIDGCVVFSGAQSWIKSTTLPYSIYVYKSIFRALFPFALQLLMILAVILYLGATWNPSVFLVAPALIIYIIGGVGLQYLLGLLAARFRDLSHLTTTISRILVFITPILWVREEREGIVRFIADINPLTHLIEILRAPLMGAPIHAISWYVSIALAACIWLTALLVAKRVKRRLPFWV